MFQKWYFISTINNIFYYIDVHKHDVISFTVKYNYINNHLIVGLFILFNDSLNISGVSIKRHFKRII